MASRAYAQLILDHLIDLKADGSFRLEPRLLRLLHRPDDDQRAVRRAVRRPAAQAGRAARRSAHMDLAASIQAVTEEVVLRLTRALATETGMREPLPRRRRRAQLRRQRQGPARRPLRATSGSSPRPATPAARSARRSPATTFTRAAADVPAAGRMRMQGAYLGPGVLARQTSKRALRARRRALRRCSTTDALIDARADAPRATARRSAGSRAAWSSARARSAPARSSATRARPTMQSMLNLKVKYRESFRPFAPSVLREDVADWFELDADSPYMLLVADVARNAARDDDAERAGACSASTSSTCRAPTSRRSRTSTTRRASRPCTRETNPRYHALISARSRQLTGCPVLVNTSFNVRGEPIVCTPEDAFRCFMGTEIDVLAVGNCYPAQGRAGSGAEARYERRARPRLRPPPDRPLRVGPRLIRISCRRAMWRSLRGLPVAHADQQKMRARPSPSRRY